MSVLAPDRAAKALAESTAFAQERSTSPAAAPDAAPKSEPVTDAAAEESATGPNPSSRPAPDFSSSFSEECNAPVMQGRALIASYSTRREREEEE